ncbi:MAG: S8 family serine peptidase, partial [Armatimonadota bacterium]
MRAFRLRIAVSFLSGCLGVLSLGAGSAALPSVPSAQTKGQAALPNVLETRLRSPCVTPRHESIEQGRRALRESKGRRVHLLLRLDRVADTSLKRQLGRAGIHLVAYRSPNTWFASFPTDLPIGHPVLARVRWVGRVPPADKLAPALREDTVGDWARTPDDQLHLVVRYFADADAEHLGRQLKTLGATILGQVPALHRMTLSLPKAHVSKLARQDAIRWIEPVPPPAAAECDRARSHIVADPVYPTLQGAGVAVGVFEGYHVCADHPGFGARAAQGDTDILRLDEESSHPTKMAGLIGGDGSQSISFGAATSRQWRGVAPQVDIFSYAFPYGAPDASSNYLDDLQEAIQNDGLDVASNAWGSTGGCRSVPYGEYLGMDADLDAIVLGALGRPISIVFSAGNERDGYYMTYTVQLTHGTYTLSDTFVDCISDAAPPFSNYGTLNHPKAAKNTIVVGAIDSYDNKMSDYSSWGPTADGRIKPDLVASGHHNGTDDQGISILDNRWGTPPGAPNQQGYRAPCDDF